MNLSNHVVLITGGASGIGLALAERLFKAGSEVILVGRDAAKLAAAKAKNPRFHTRACDVTKPAERIALRDWAIAEFPKLDVLINNAGVMRMVKLGDEPEAWDTSRQELLTNLEAPIHLAALFAPHLGKQASGTLVNVTSGLAFVPMAAFPIYCATKAALHSFTLSLQHQLPALKVVELAPPHVNTDRFMAGANGAGMPLDVFADAAVEGLAKDLKLITYGFSQNASAASAAERDELFKVLNTPH